MSYSCNPMDYSLPGSSVHGFLQARILEWVAISFSRGSYQPRDSTQVYTIAGSFFTNWATKEALSTRMAIIEKIIVSVGENMEEKEPSCTADENINWCSHHGKDRSFLKKYKENYQIIQQFYFWVFIQRKRKSLSQKGSLYTFMFIAALLTLAKRGKQSKCPLRDEWRKETWWIYNSAIEREILPLGAQWIDLEGIMLNEISQTEKDEYYMTWLVCGIKKPNLSDTENWWLPEVEAQEVGKWVKDKKK